MNILLVEGQTYRGALFLLTMDECLSLKSSKSLEVRMPDSNKIARVIAHTKKVATVIAANPLALSTGCDVCQVISYEQLKSISEKPNMITLSRKWNGVQWKFAFACSANVVADKVEKLLASVC